MAITWNMGGFSPELGCIDKVFQKDNVGHDMYVFGSQEAVRSITSSMMLPSKEKLNAQLMGYFGDKFVMVNSISLAATHMIVIIKKELAPYLSQIENDELALGHGDVLANKGSVCVGFQLGKLRLLFINSHF